MPTSPCLGPDMQFECPTCGSLEPCVDLQAYWDATGTRPPNYPARKPTPAHDPFLRGNDELCMPCRGTGRTQEPTPRDTTLIETCFHCGGSGRKSVRLG